jgi:hypothetical protein
MSSQSERRLLTFDECCDKINSCTGDKMKCVTNLKPEISFDTFKLLVPAIVDFGSVEKIRFYDMFIKNFDELFYVLDLYPDTDYKNAFVSTLVHEVIQNASFNVLFEKLKILFSQYCNYISPAAIISIIEWQTLETIGKYASLLLDFNLVEPRELLEIMLEARKNSIGCVSYVEKVVNALQEHGFDVDDFFDGEFLHYVLMFRGRGCYPKLIAYISNWYEPQILAKWIVHKMDKIEINMLTNAINQGIDVSGLILEANNK